MQQRSLLCISRFDSFLRVAVKTGSFFEAAEYRVEHRLVSSGKGNSLYKRALKEAGLPVDTPSTALPQIIEDASLWEYDAIYLSLTGAGIRRFIHSLSHQPIPSGKYSRPVIFCGYPGVILKDKLLGFANRSGCDFVLLNSKADLADYKSFCQRYALNDNNAFLYGYTNFKTRRPSQDRLGYKKTILFAEQAVIPQSQNDRLYLCSRLVQYAKNHPDHLLLIKPRLKPGEKSLFSTQFHFEYLLAEFEYPSNITISYENIDSLLDKCDFCWTVSSTVAVQALQHGIPTAIISDFGPNDNHGTDFFRQSGCLANLDQLESGFIPSPQRDWMEQNITIAEVQQTELVARVNALIDRQIEAKASLAWSKNYAILFSPAWLEWSVSRKKQRGITFRLYIKNLQCQLAECIEKLKAGLKLLLPVRRHECL